MCHLNQVKHSKTSAMFYLNYVKQNTMSIFQKYVTLKTSNTFCFHQSKHSAISVICYLNQVKH